ncbi:F-box only protein 33-like [Uloborus diversus]|uniref:F-box only protein 33-like n=1 Tax=Uloborus diversus TaxID=327109 RepID=UPI0024093BF5|nr:F-box only protein 33-like [Uloborus diversus]
MAGKSSGLWSNLPSIIIVEIFSFLSLKDRLNAASVCKAWRNHLFHPQLWRKVVFQLNSCDIKTVNHKIDGARFLAKQCGKFVREAVIEVNSLNPKDVRLCKNILRVLTFNRNLRALSIKPRSSRLEWSDYEDTLSLDQYIKFLVTIIKKARRLEHLSFGCIEELLDSSEYFLKPLAQHQSNSIRSLHLSSVKEVPGNYFVYDISSTLFESFRNLESLSIDYDYMSDDLLIVLSKPHHRPLNRLIIHVHSLPFRLNEISSEAWKQISCHSPKLEVTINMLHFHNSPEYILAILKHEMPLVHFRAFFSSGFNEDVITRLAFISKGSLKSFVLVDELDEDSTPASVFPSSNIDPLIMLAWRCKKLSYIKIIGYEVGADSLVAISRLRGEQLSDLLVPACCISTVLLEDMTHLSPENAVLHLRREVSFGLQKPWRPLNLSELPLAVRNVNVDADGAYLDELLGDQKW